MTPFWIDLLERMVWTFVQAFLAALTANGLNIVDLGGWEAAAIAGLGAVLSLLKSVAAHRLEELGTAQLIPFSRGTYSHESEAGHA